MAGRPRARRSLAAAVLLIALAALSACVPALVPPLPPIATLTAPPPTASPPTATVPPSPTAMPVPSATPLAPAVAFAPGVPEGLRARVRAALGPGYVEAAAEVASSAAVQVFAGALEGAYPLAEDVFVPAVAFPTIADDLAWADLQAYWAGDTGRLAALADGAGAPALYIDAGTYAALAGLLGPQATGVPLQIVAPDELASAVWAARPLSWAIVPFDRLQPSLKALTVDGRSALSRQLDLTAYPLQAHYSVSTSPEIAATLGVAEAPWRNRDPEQLTVLMMTGVTALGRATAWKMELNGVLYPGLRVRDILLDHDLLHISNEVSFAANCPFPNPNGDTLFCASPRYIELLRDIGVDIVELSGNHNDDWGPEAARLSLEIYQQEGWPHFAGGWDRSDALNPLTVTDHGNTFVFVGCNPVGPGYAWAADGYPGSAPCDEALLAAQIGQARAAGALPIMTWQYFEIYDYAATADQAAAFRAMAEAGAVIVSGSQAHHPQGFDFSGGSFIHYGLGNLFFDQMDLLGTRQEFADQHIFYQGRHLSTRLFTFMLEDYAQPRPMTPAERADLLRAVFRASGW
jgi:poly-gamma-glutamate synthesis protein (capsule biosynthesis protein)